MKLNIKQNNTKQKNIPINSASHRIDQIKGEIKNCSASAEPCEVEVMDMWTEIDAKTG